MDMQCTYVMFDKELNQPAILSLHTSISAFNSVADLMKRALSNMKIYSVVDLQIQNVSPAQISCSGLTLSLLTGKET